MSHSRVFIGSSAERLWDAKTVASMLKDAGIDAIGWWRDDVFPPGSTFIESVQAVVKKVNAALIILSPDDETVSRGIEYWAPRDNLLLEYGLFVSRHGRDRVAVAQLENPKLPTDLLGVTHVRLASTGTDLDRFQSENWKEVMKWVNHLEREGPLNQLEDNLPRLYSTLVGLNKRLAQSEVDLRWFDQWASDVLSFLQGEADPEPVAEWLDAQLTNHVDELAAIMALDAIGPELWVNPSHYRYLAVQLRQFVLHNGETLSGPPVVSEPVARAIERSNQRFARSGGEVLRGVNGDPHWQTGTPEFEIVRILLWSRGEILSPVSKSVIDIHELFGVPLFFKEVSSEDDARETSFVCLQKKTGGVFGQYFKRSEHFVPRPIAAGRPIPQVGDARDCFMEVLADDDVLLASQARYLLANS